VSRDQIAPFNTIINIDGTVTEAPGPPPPPDQAEGPWDFVGGSLEGALLIPALPFFPTGGILSDGDLAVVRFRVPFEISVVGMAFATDGAPGVGRTGTLGIYIGTALQRSTGPVAIPNAAGQIVPGSFSPFTLLPDTHYFGALLNDGGATPIVAANFNINTRWTPLFGGSDAAGTSLASILISVAGNALPNPRAGAGYFNPGANTPLLWLLTE
jgi:hypothetical protein